jgi:hypothetical protein
MITPVMTAAVRAQAWLTRQNVEDLRPILTMPLVTLISLAVLVHDGKPGAAPYGVRVAFRASSGLLGRRSTFCVASLQRGETPSFTPVECCHSSVIPS